MTPMGVQEYIEQEIKKCGHYTQTRSDCTFLRDHSTEEYLYRKIVSKRYRKWSLSLGEEGLIQKAINISVRNNKPIQFVFPFGGYKLWRLNSAPRPDWAEIFATIYYCQYLAPIANVHKPGVIFYFCSDDIVAQKMDNIPTADTDIYFSDLEKIIKHIQSFLPKNFFIKTKRIGDLYDGDDFEIELKELVPKAKNIIKQWGQFELIKSYQSSELNYLFKGHDDFSLLTDKEKHIKIEMALVLHEAYRCMSQKIGFVYQDNKIVLASKKTTRGIALGATKNSSVKFWVGTGIIEKNGSEYSMRVLSYQQEIKLDKTKIKILPVSFSPLKHLTGIIVYGESLTV